MAKFEIINKAEDASFISCNEMTLVYPYSEGEIQNTIESGRNGYEIQCNLFNFRDDITVTIEVPNQEGLFLREQVNLRKGTNEFDLPLSGIVNVQTTIKNFNLEILINDKKLSCSPVITVYPERAKLQNIDPNGTYTSVNDFEQFTVFFSKNIKPSGNNSKKLRIKKDNNVIQEWTSNDSFIITTNNYIYFDDTLNTLIEEPGEYYIEMDSGFVLDKEINLPCVGWTGKHPFNTFKYQNSLQLLSANAGTNNYVNLYWTPTVGTIEVEYSTNKINWTKSQYTFNGTAGVSQNLKIDDLIKNTTVYFRIKLAGQQDYSNYISYVWHGEKFYRLVNYLYSDPYPRHERLAGWDGKVALKPGDYQVDYSHIPTDTVLFSMNQNGVFGVGSTMYTDNYVKLTRDTIVDFEWDGSLDNGDEYSSYGIGFIVIYNAKDKPPGNIKYYVDPITAILTREVVNDNFIP